MGHALGLPESTSVLAPRQVPKSPLEHEEPGHLEEPPEEPMDLDGLLEESAGAGRGVDSQARAGMVRSTGDGGLELSLPENKEIASSSLEQSNVVRAFSWARPLVRGVISVAKPATGKKVPAYSKILQALPAFDHRFPLVPGFQKILLGLHSKSSLISSQRGQHATSRPLLSDRSIQATDELEARLEDSEFSVSSVMEMAERRKGNQEEELLHRYEEAMVLDILEINGDRRLKNFVTDKLTVYMNIRNEKVPTSAELTWEKTLLFQTQILKEDSRTSLDNFLPHHLDQQCFKENPNEDPFLRGPRSMGGALQHRV